MSEIEQAKKFVEFFWRAKFDDTLAKAGLEQNGEIVTFMGGFRAPDHFVVRFASENSSSQPLWLNRVTARKLCQILVQEGFSS
jgi:hypothetical protein